MRNINIQEEAEDLSPLHMAIEADNLDDFLDLLGRGFGTVASRNAIGLSPLHLAVRLRRRRIVDYLLPTFVAENSTDAWGLNHLHVAAMTEEVYEENLVCEYIRQGVLVDQRVVAVSELEEVANFVQESRLAQIRDSWPLQINSYWKNDHKGIQYWPGYAALHFAVENCNYRAADELLLYGADPNIANDALITPLHMACALEPKVGLQFVKRLVAAGAKPDVVSRQGQTPLHVAIYYCNDEAIAEMKKKKESFVSIALSKPSIIFVYCIYEPIQNLFTLIEQRKAKKKKKKIGIPSRQGFSIL